MALTPEMIYFAILFHQLFYYRSGGTACTQITGSSVDELDRECASLRGYQPTYRELTSPVTGVPTLFETFTAMTEKQTFGRIERFDMTLGYGLCRVRNGTTHIDGKTLDHLIETSIVRAVANQSTLTITFPLIKLINLRWYINGRMQDYAVYRNSGYGSSHNYHYKCKNTSNFTEEMYITALEKCKPHGGFDSHAEFDTGEGLPIWTAEKFVNTSAVIDECGHTRTVLGPIGRLEIPFDICDNEIYWQTDYRGQEYEYVCCFNYRRRVSILLVSVVIVLLACHLSLHALKKSFPV